VAHPFLTPNLNHTQKRVPYPFSRRWPTRAIFWLEWGVYELRCLLIRTGGFLELAELIDLHLALGEHGFNLQLAPMARIMDCRVLMYISARRSILETAGLVDAGFPL
jgi:hypothetical protein